jgi:cell division protein FtsB
MKNDKLTDRINRLKTNSIDLDFLDEKVREKTGFLDNNELVIIFNE